MAHPPRARSESDLALRGGHSFGHCAPSDSLLVIIRRRPHYRRLMPASWAGWANAAAARRRIHPTRAAVRAAAGRLPIRHTYRQGPGPSGPDKLETATALDCRTRTEPAPLVPSPPPLPHAAERPSPPQPAPPPAPPFEGPAACPSGRGPERAGTCHRHVSAGGATCLARPPWPSLSAARPTSPGPDSDAPRGPPPRLSTRPGRPPPRARGGGGGTVEGGHYLLAGEVGGVGPAGRPVHRVRVSYLPRRGGGVREEGGREREGGRYGERERERVSERERERERERGRQRGRERENARS